MNIEIITKDIKDNLKVHPQGDLSDLGNSIGVILGRYIDSNSLGYEIHDFISGIEHGVSLNDGTHDI